MQERGKFIAVEGVGGAGKSTQLPKAKNYLDSYKVDPLGVKITREPGGQPHTELIRDFLFDLNNEGVLNGDMQLAIFNVARLLWVQYQVYPVVGSGGVLLTDRTYPATRAYQVAGEGVDLAVAEKMIKRAMTTHMGDTYLADAVILLDIDAETAIKRKLNSEGDKFDEKGLSYTKKIIDEYRKMAKENWLAGKWYVVDGEQKENVVEADIQDILKEIFNL